MTEEQHRGSGWGIGVGLILGIILALLTLLRLPFIDGPELRTAAAAKRASATVDDRLSEPYVANSEEPNGNIVAEPSPSDSSPPTVQAAPLPAADETKLVRDTPGDLPRLPVEAPRPELLPPLPHPSEDYVIGEDPAALLAHARFLIKAGLAPMAPAPLRKIVKDAPGTPIAREAARTLDALSRN